MIQRAESEVVRQKEQADARYASRPDLITVPEFSLKSNAQARAEKEGIPFPVAPSWRLPVRMVPQRRSRWRKQD